MPVATHDDAVAECLAAAEHFLATAPDRPEGLLLRALGARHDGRLDDARADLRALADRDRAGEAAPVARLLLLLELIGAGGDLAEVARTAAEDFAVEERLVPLLRALLTNPGGLPPSITIDVVGQAFTWPVHPDRANHVAAYHHLPAAHNEPATTDAFYLDYARYESPQVARAARLVDDLAAHPAIRDHLRPGAAVLDAGCGAGEVLAALVARHGVEPHGVDMSAAAGDLAARRVPGLRFEQSQLTALPYADGTFDAVVCTDVLEHVRHPHVVAAELARVTKPGGIVVVSVPDGRYDSYAGHVNFFSTQSLEAMLEPLGAAVELDLHTDGVLAVLTR